jgi:Tfp pilus assembly protein PilO
MRRNVLLSALVALLLVALYYMLLFQPTREEIAAAQASMATVQAEQQAIQAEIFRLETVREQSPEAEAELATALAIVPQTTSSPSLLRQLQLSADDAGLTLGTVTLGRPVVSLTDPTLAEMSVAAQLTGSYFQVIDFLRRVEDPSISIRGVMWDAVSVTPTEYPELAVSLTGRTFADASTVPPTPEALALEAAPAEGDSEGDEDATDEESDIESTTETEATTEDAS